MNSLERAIARYEEDHELMVKLGIPIRSDVLTNYLQAKRTIAHATTGQMFEKTLIITGEWHPKSPDEARDILRTAVDNRWQIIAR